tara:strand:- start:2167 stop:7755 length:5589 start_codon:yes stop_codon:yes gene_type:complete
MFVNIQDYIIVNTQQTFKNILPHLNTTSRKFVSNGYFYPKTMKRKLKKSTVGLYDPSKSSCSCGVGFITRKDGIRTHDILRMGHEAMCSVPHRGGMSSKGVGDGAGISIDLSPEFFSKVTGRDLKAGDFGVGNFFLNEKIAAKSSVLIEEKLLSHGFEIIQKRFLKVNDSVLRKDAIDQQHPICQWIFDIPDDLSDKDKAKRIHQALIEIESIAFVDEQFDGLYPLSLSSHTQVFKGRLNSWEIMPYFNDLNDHDHKVHTLYFHTRFSTNTDPHPSMAQPFRLMAHNGELNTDKKNRLNEAALARARERTIYRPKGQSDSCRLDQTLSSRVYDDDVDLVTAVVAMMPPAWENDLNMPSEVRAMFEYFSLFEEKNDGPAAVIFGNGNIVGARLDRLGLRPLRTVETNEYLAVMSEAGQVVFPESEVIDRGRIEAGGMIYFNHLEHKIYRTDEALCKLSSEKDYTSLVVNSQLSIEQLNLPNLSFEKASLRYKGDLNPYARFVAYYHNQESFKFLMDPMLYNGVEKVSAMGFGNAINALSDNEGGVTKYFSQRFAQVTNPPLDSIRESDGMTLRVALGEKPNFGHSRSKQLVLSSPVLRMLDIIKINSQSIVPVKQFEILYKPDFDNQDKNTSEIVKAINRVSGNVADFAREFGGIAILTDRHISSTEAAIPSTLVISAINQKLISEGLRLKISLILESGQLASSHQCACALGFGASAVYPLAVRLRSEQLFSEQESVEAYNRFKKACEKALLKTMGKVGLCTVESYIGGEFFEPNFLDTNELTLRRIFPNMKTPVGGVRFESIAQSSIDWHNRSLNIENEIDIPILGLFKERTEGAGHSYGTLAVRGFVDMTKESILFKSNSAERDDLRLYTLNQLEDVFGADNNRFARTSYEKLTNAEIDNFTITSGYRAFSQMMAKERIERPSALRDVIAYPADFSSASTVNDFLVQIQQFDRIGNLNFAIRGLHCEELENSEFVLSLPENEPSNDQKLKHLVDSLKICFENQLKKISIARGKIYLTANDDAYDFLSRVIPAPSRISLKSVEPASKITACLASGAMSHGALVATAHEAVAHGVNMAGAMSNSGEGGEHISRYGTIRASRIKQFASGRFGVWAGYLADPNLEEIEIKIGQGAKPGEGGQLPAPKVTVEIAAARGATPGVELVSPPPHHDTYSIEDLGQLIHDAKAARVRVIVKLVSSEGIGTIAVGVAKAGADIINIAGNTGGTGAASVTSLKYTGRAAEIGISEVHQALSANGIRQKVKLRCSGAMQTGSDVIKASLLGGDSFEFGTTALMMLKCVMAKNCNIKCPAGLTTNAEAFEGDPRALAQYILNVAHEVREILAELGFSSLRESRGRTDLLHLFDHPSSIGQLNLRNMLTRVEEKKVKEPIYLEKDYSLDEQIFCQFKKLFFTGKSESFEIVVDKPLGNRNKSVGGQLSIDIERFLNYESNDVKNYSKRLENGRVILKSKILKILTNGSAGQSYGVFCNDGISLEHRGTCNDGVGKGMCGGEIKILSPDGSKASKGKNVLVGNFALFGATGGRLFIEGQAGDRFAVRNSGTTAVVEGVGDFCAEYMTNGSILNLGVFSKGLGNGMSGGFVYQYDPHNLLQDMVSHDSVLFGRLNDGSENAQIHEDCVKRMLKWHYSATHSVRAKIFIEEWDTIRKDFSWIMPKAFLKYQCADTIFATSTRKQLSDELSNALVTYQIDFLKAAWKNNAPFLNGYIPDYGETDTEEMFQLVNSYTILDFAREIASKKFKFSGEDLDRKIKNLVLTNDFNLKSLLAKHALQAIDHYDDKELAVLVANKRITDFKHSLNLRITSDMDELGTQKWIKQQDKKNESALGSIPSYNELFAKKSLPEVFSRNNM